MKLVVGRQLNAFGWMEKTTVDLQKSPPLKNKICGACTNGNGLINAYLFDIFTDAGKLLADGSVGVGLHRLHFLRGASHSLFKCSS